MDLSSLFLLLFTHSVKASKTAGLFAHQNSEQVETAENFTAIDSGKKHCLTHNSYSSACNSTFSELTQFC
jgi:hypothetical protein